MKNKIKYILQKVLGFERYLYIFSKFKIKTLSNDANEKDFFHFLNLIKDKEGDMIDIGANIGIMTYYLASSFPKSTVHAFEPIPINFITLKKIVTKFQLGNVELYPFALGQTLGKIKMIMPYDGKTKMQGLSHVIHESIDVFNEGDQYEVAVKTLDELFANTKIQAIKIDVENFEYFVFKGGENLLKNNKPIIYAELWDNENRKNSFDFLQNIGYSIYVVDNDQLVLYEDNKHITQNFIFK
ncbi:MAG: FkbM family methyltransferase [Crocinitomicaceae bacterium]|nr:FkbM family methyltransferase [Crocinitomicaceae bacterium]